MQAYGFWKSDPLVRVDGFKCVADIGMHKSVWNTIFLASHAEMATQPALGNVGSQKDCSA